MDDADRAQHWEERERQAAIEAALANKAADQVIVDGVVVCMDCGVEIDARRLQLVPKASCCINCQTIRERTGHV